MLQLFFWHSATWRPKLSPLWLLLPPFAFLKWSIFLLSHWSHGFVEKKGKKGKKPFGNWTSAGVCTPWAWSASPDGLKNPSEMPFPSILAQLPQFIFLSLFFFTFLYIFFILPSLFPVSNSESAFRQKKNIFTCPYSWLCETKPELRRSRISCSASEFHSASKNELLRVWANGLSTRRIWITTIYNLF